MIQATGLTTHTRQGKPPTVDDVSFEARAGRVTALLGAAGSGTGAALRLMLELQPGRGVTYFRGRPLHRIPHPSREVGVLLGQVPGHPGRSVRGQLRMLCAAVGVPVVRADDVLEVVGLVSLRDERLGTLSRGLDRRLGLACALLGDPHTLVLDSPADGLSSREAAWLHGVLRAYAGQGGTVLFATADAKEAARTADHVVTLERGKIVGDQAVEDFARTRLRPRVAVVSPYAARLAALLTKEARVGRRSVEVAREGGNRLSVYGSSCAAVGDIAFRHGVLVHQLADETGDSGPSAPLPHEESGNVTGDDHEWTDGDLDQAPTAPPTPEAADECTTTTAPGATASTRGAEPARAPSPVAASLPVTPDQALSPLPPPISVRPSRAPLRPLRYELRRALGVSTGFLVVLSVLAVSAVTAVVLARTGHTPVPRLLAAWHLEMPLPPAALGAGLLGALAFGDEFRHPALAVDRGTVPRRIGLLLAKLLVSAVTAAILAVITLLTDRATLHLFYGDEMTAVPGNWPSLLTGWIALAVGCAWAGVLAAGVFRSTAAGLAAVLAVPVALVPAVQKLLAGPAVRSATGLPERLRELALVPWPAGGNHYVASVVRILAQPVGGALLLSLGALLVAYVLTSLRPRPRAR
ncbi:Sulfate/thiosulfate import ATP-binding protein CysA [Streptomyces sp. YIM 130001]|uniref:ATP-binding cassette domain-containing protein n=1 Tax=Streptomyces sp. YIM 130001 TaxID=2259644 RepID=UPI000E648A7D|nr:ATP-binding cassette domain-containing protein [Streptomyces sp. YIM 130001]RII09438.1 Sulfate/thiosulfate import ATP-binding protein CysA [Streptomyces sp. YIM 130001]